MNLLKIAMVVAVCTVLACKTSSADIIALESFDYGFSDVLVQVPGSGTGFSTNWIAGGRNSSTSSFRVQSSSLLFPGVDSAGRSVIGAASLTSIFGAHRQTNQAFVGASVDQTSWMSFLIRQTDIGGQLGGFGGIYVGNSTNEFDPKLFIGKGGTNNWLMENLGGSGQVQSNTAVATQQTTLLVVKMETLPGNDRFTLFVNPTNDSEPTGGFVKTDLDLGTANRISMYHAGAFSFDEIRIGTSFFDVVTAVPEPSSLLLVLATATISVATNRGYISNRRRKLSGMR